MLKAENIYKSYGKKEVLKGAGITVAPGQIAALVGKNGCGKSTLIQILSGTLKPDRDENTFFGKNPLSDKRLFAKFIGYVPQDNPLFEELTVKDNLRFWAGGLKDTDRGVLKNFELEDIMKNKVSELSGGMKRRLAIACVIQRKPPIVILDEPTSSLDLFYQETIRAWMKDYAAHNGTVILSTHYEQEIECADSVWIFNDGRTDIRR